MWRLLLIPMLLGSAVASSQSVYYPLEVGNRWRYTNSDFRIVGDTVMPNGKGYSHIKQSTTTIAFERQDGLKVYRYYPPTDTEYLYLDFGLEAGDTVSIYSPGFDTTAITLSWKGMDTVFGRSLRGWWFWIDNSIRGIDDEYAVLVVDSVGVAEIGATFYWEYLTGAEINGVGYGILSDVVFHPNELPSGFRLEQNFPNPFNSSTQISFYLPKRSDVMVAIYDIQGRCIRLDRLGPLGHGVNTWTIGSDMLSSGIYLYRVYSGDRMLQGKMVVLK